MAPDDACPAGSPDELVAPVVPERLGDLVRFCELRGRHGHGKFAWCACMRWRMRSGEFQASTPAQRRAALYDLAACGVPVGVLAYAGGEPIGWCSVAPWQTYQALERSRSLLRPADTEIWSVVCFFIDSRYRRSGLTRVLPDGAVAFAGDCSAPGVEGYPVEPGPHSYTYMGTPSTFAACGFADVTPPGCSRTVVQRMLQRTPLGDGEARDA
jgi:GNAT superfamily N-acetyltransferase